jgi:anaerobic magnesium-protoporphyrin IX monomethyl ester cyclase
MADIVLAKMENEEERHALAPPFGILYLAHSLEQAGFSVQLIHETGIEANIKRLTELVSAEKPLFVGLSTLTGPTILPTMQASKAIKETQPVPVVWGGLHPTMLPQQTLMNDFIDIVVVGEGERTVVELAEVLREHGPEAGKLAQVTGIAFKSDGKAIFTEPRPFIRDMDDLYPAWHHVDVGRYFRPGKHFYDDHGFQISGEKIGAIITSRGCPWRCGFCYNQIVNKRVFRAHSAQRVISDVKTYKKQYGITAIVFEDDCFFAAKNRGLEIIRNIGIPWSSNLRADQMAKWGDEFAKELSQHNCMELRIAIESGSQRVLDIMKKDITVDEHRRSVELCVKYDIPVTVGFMIGLPGETWADTLETLAFIDELEKMGDHVRTLGPGIYMPYPGTPLFNAAVEEYGFEPPTSLQEWSDCIFGPKQPLAPYVDKRIQFIAHYKRLNFRTDLDRLAFSLPTKMMRQMARWRWRHRFFRFPLDYTLPSFGLNLLTKLGLAGMYGKLRKSMWKS